MELIIDDAMETRLREVAKKHDLHLDEVADIIFDHVLSDTVLTHDIFGEHRAPTNPFKETS